MQGPFMIPPSIELGVAPSVTAMAVALATKPATCCNPSLRCRPGHRWAGHPRHHGLLRDDLLLSTVLSSLVLLLLA